MTKSITTTADSLPNLPEIDDAATAAEGVHEKLTDAMTPGYQAEFDPEEPVTAERPVELCRLYSTTEFIGKGVGQALMDECLKLARERNCDVMWLGVWEFNPRAQRFYEKQGFRIVGEHVFQLGSDPQTDHLMQIELA